jgi:hypothetical protein
MSEKNVLQILTASKLLFCSLRRDAFLPLRGLGFLDVLYLTILFSLPAQAAVTTPNPTAPAAAGRSVNICDLLVPRLPNVKTRLCMNAELQPTQGKSVQGRVLFSRDISAASPQLRILVIGGIHGDEKSSGSLVLHWIEHASETPSNALWRFIPVLNPDGLVAKPARRMNANGVDLNRNFPTPQWAKEAKFYWETRTRRDPRRWPGPKPLSEPESRFLHSEMDTFKPDLIVSIHAPYGLLDYDGPSAPPPKLGRLFLDQVGIFPGSLGNYAGVNRGVPVVTIELPNALLTPTDAEMRQMWLDLLRWVNERVKPSTTASQTLRTE